MKKVETKSAKEATTKENNNGTAFKISECEPAIAMVKDKDDKIGIVFGKYIVSQKRFKNFEEAEEYINTRPYDIIINIAYIISHEKEM